MAHKKLGVGLLVVTTGLEILHALQLQLLPPPPSSLAPKSRMETFWYPLTLVHLENGSIIIIIIIKSIYIAQSR